MVRIMRDSGIETIALSSWRTALLSFTTSDAFVISNFRTGPRRKVPIVREVKILASDLGKYDDENKEKAGIVNRMCLPMRIYCEDSLQTSQNLI